MRQIFLALAFTALAACSQESPPANQADDSAAAPEANLAVADGAGDKPSPASFEGMDSNGDGTLTAAEHAASAGAMFDAMDGDHDGSVTAAEMGQAQAALGGSSAMSPADKIKAVDGNGDGMLAKAEHVTASAGMFGKMDDDRNGSLSKAEFDAGHKALMGGN